MTRIYSYVVRYDSGFAPNPFYGFCTLATCKPDIRRAANVGDWIVGSGSNDRSIRRGGHLVYAMQVPPASEELSLPRILINSVHRSGASRYSILIEAGTAF